MVPCDPISCSSSGRPSLTQAALVILPDARREPQVRRCGVALKPIFRTLASRCIPDAAMRCYVGEELAELAVAIAPPDQMRVQHHGETAPAFVLRV